MKTENLLKGSVARAFYGNFIDLHSIQKAAVVPIVNGANLILSARTGLGKTEAVMAPIISKYLEHMQLVNSLSVLYIAPTKALVNDLEKRLLAPLSRIGLKLGIRHGDKDDMKNRNSPQILITTPESLDVMMFRKDKSLLNIQAVIIDEVHLLYNTQRGLQLSILLNRLNIDACRKIQWVALSATISSPEHIRDFFFGSDEKYEFVCDTQCRPVDAQIRCLDSISDLKSLFTKLLKKKKGKFLVFANSRRECEEVASALANTDFSPYVFAHYSSLSHDIRESVEKAFNISPCAICIATSTLELGIDIGDIDAIFLYGPTHNIESFLQRIGRGCRRLEKTNVVCLVRKESKSCNLEMLIFHALILLARDSKLPECKPYELFGAAAQQALSYIGSRESQFTAIKDVVKNASCFKHISRARIEDILSALAEKEYIKPHGFKNSYGPGEKLYSLIDYRMIYGNFPIGSQTIALYYDKKVLGDIPKINLLRFTTGDTIRFAGKAWHITHMSNDDIHVSPTHSGNSAKNILYMGSGLGIDPFVLNKVWDIIHSKEMEESLYSVSCRDHTVNMLTSLRKTIPHNSIPYYCFSGNYIYFTFAGALVNKAIALVSGQTSYAVDDLKLSCQNEINWESIPARPEEYESVFDEILNEKSDQTFYQTLIPDNLQKYEYLQMWLKNATIGTHLQRLKASVPYRISQSDIEKWEF